MLPPARTLVPVLSLVWLVLLAGWAGDKQPVTAAAKAVDPEVRPASLEAVWKEIKRPGAEVVLVNIWATWCEPCLEEMPDLLQVHRENKARGLRLVLVSADPQSARPAVAKFLGTLGVDFPSLLKTGDDMEFIDGLYPKWDGTLPATLLFDGKGQRLHLWSGTVTRAELKQKLDQVLAQPRRRKP